MGKEKYPGFYAERSTQNFDLQEDLYGENEWHPLLIYAQRPDAAACAELEV